MKEEPKDYLKRVRNENGMTVKMFGDKVGKSPRTIQNYEQGRPVADVLLAMIEKMFGDREVINRGGMMKPIYIDVPGNPIAKKRPKFARVGTGVKTYNPSDTDEGKFLLSVFSQIGQIEPLTGAIRLDCKFIMQRPKGHYGTGRNAGKLKASAPKYHTIKPDRDNLDKFVMDSLNGYLWRDDCQVVQGEPTKEYCNPNDRFGPRTLIKIYAIEGK